MIFPTGYTSEQRYQLARLADMPNLNLATYEHYRERIFAGEDVFEPRASLSTAPDTTRRRYAEETAELVLDYLANHRRALTVEVRDALGLGKHVEYVLVKLYQAKKVTRQTARRDGVGGRQYLWSLADE